MNDELFPMPPSPPDTLEAARKALAEAQAAYDEADAWEDESGEAVPPEVVFALCTARKDVLREELRRIRETP